MVIGVFVLWNFCITGCKYSAVNFRTNNVECSVQCWFWIEAFPSLILDSTFNYYLQSAINQSQETVYVVCRTLEDGSRLRSPYINYHSSCFNQQLYQIGSEGGREWNHYYKFIKHVSPFHLRFCIPPKFKFSNILFHHSPSSILVSIRITLLLLL